MKRDVRVAAVVMRSEVGQPRQNLDKSAYWARKAVGQGAQMVCFPELSLTGYTSGPDAARFAEPPDGPSIREMGRLAVDLSATLLFGIALKGSSGNIYAAQGAAFASGRVSFFHKIHVSPPEQGLFSPGNRIPVFQDSRLCFGIQLCYDAHFPHLSLHMAQNGAHALFFPHASPRGTAGQKLDSWLRHLTARAFDNGVYVVAVNQVGDNGLGLCFPGAAVVVGPDGNVAEQYTGEGEGILFANLSARRLREVREHRMRFFLPNTRSDLGSGDVEVISGEGSAERGALPQATRNPNKKPDPPRGGSGS